MVLRLRVVFRLKNSLTISAGPSFLYSFIFSPDFDFLSTLCGFPENAGKKNVLKFDELFASLFFLVELLSLILSIAEMSCVMPLIDYTVLPKKLMYCTLVTTKLWEDVGYFCQSCFGLYESDYGGERVH